MFERPGRAVVEAGMKVKAFNPYRKFNRTRHSLGELVAAVGAATEDSREAVAALIDLFQTGRVQLRDHGHLKRVRVSA
jgi:malonyl CoA-acyl carrier protein transacylase